MKSEFRIVYRREGGKTQYRIFQRAANVDGYVELLTDETPRDDLAPIVFLEIEERLCGPWVKLDRPRK